MFKTLITQPLGWIIEQIYNLVQNYGLAIILFTIVVKLILLPLNIKSQRAMKKQQMVQPVIAELQKKYANDKEKLQREMMKIYKDNNISMTGGCLPMLIQFPILIGLYQVIRRPLEFLKGIDFSLDTTKAMVEQLVTKLPQNVQGQSLDMLWNNYQIQLSKAAEGISGFRDWFINFNFFGLDLSRVPSEALSSIVSGDFSDMGKILIIIIPVLAVIATWLSSKITQVQSGQKQDDESQAAQMSKTMMLMMPVMTGVFTFTLPSGMGVYWIISSVMQVVQQVALNKYFSGKEDEIVVKVKDYSSKKRKKRK